MTNTLTLTLEGTWNLEERGKKPDGSPDVRSNESFSVRLVLDHREIVWEKTFPRDKLPIRPEERLAGEISNVLQQYIPRIDPRFR